MKQAVTQNALVAALAAALAMAAGAPAVAQPAAASAAVAAAPSLRGGVPRCRFAVPEGWEVRQVRWTGDCRDGLAQGLGTLRWLQGNRVRQVFYGRLENGQPVLGAIELDGGWRAGRFEAGRAVSDGERNTLIEAFDTASQAARQVAQHYQAAGNPASARLYRQKAEQLARQMD